MKIFKLRNSPLITGPGSIFYIENHIFSTPHSEIIFFPPYIFMQECKNKHILDHFVLVFEQIVFINFQFSFSLNPFGSVADPDLWIRICIIKVGSGSVWRDTNPDPGHIW